MSASSMLSQPSPEWVGHSLGGSVSFCHKYPGGESAGNLTDFELSLYKIFLILKAYNLDIESSVLIIFNACEQSAG